MPRGAIFIFNGLSTQGTTSSSLDYRWIGGRCRFALEAPRVYSKKIIVVFYLSIFRVVICLLIIISFSGFW
jgi:hypothetical protein